MTENFDAVQNLLKIPVARRDESWETDLLRELPKASLRIVDDTAVAGPDGWPYLLVATDGGTSDQYDSVLNVTRWLATRGLGLVLNPEKAMPDFVMSYGMVWNFRERGEFLTPTASRNLEPLEIKDGQKLFAGPPSLSYLPKDVRQILKEFFKQQRVTEPKVLMVSPDEKNWDLAISIESLGAPPRSEHAGIAEAISWFLPLHYSVVLLSEKTVPGFQNL